MSTNLYLQAEKVYNQLKLIEHDLSHFLNDKSVSYILTEEDDLDREYIQSVVKHFRYLEVYCMEGKHALERLIATEDIQEEVLEKVLQGVYLKCVNGFFSPKDDIWHEDSRASYRNKMSIDFQYEPGSHIVDLTEIVEPVFQDLREQLDYLEAV
ncbi:DUF3907 family protein [Alkalibacillus silvisoli]